LSPLSRRGRSSTSKRERHCTNDCVGQHTRAFFASTPGASNAPTSPEEAFSWRPAFARRVVGNAALRRLAQSEVRSALAAVNEQIEESLALAASGRARAGSLSAWLAGNDRVTLAVVRAEATNWVTQWLNLGSIP
jgi:hypothetical protein